MSIVVLCIIYKYTIHIIFLAEKHGNIHAMKYRFYAKSAIKKSMGFILI